MNGLFLAIGFLTRVPVPADTPRPGDWGRAVRWFPLAGATVALVAVSAQLVTTLLWTPLVGAVAAVAAVVWVTGFLHVDGFADCLDGMYCNGDREKILTVMHDPRAGAIGAAGVALLLVAKIALVVACVDAGTGAGAVWVTAILARAFLPLEMAVAEPATPGKGLFARLRDEVRLRDAALAGVLAVVLIAPALVLVPAMGAGLAVGAAAAGVVTIAWGAWWRERIGGVNGDVLGAAVELRELAILASLATAWLA